MASTPTNYAREEGIFHSELPAAIVFTVIYAPLLGAFILKSVLARALVLHSLLVFCVVRIASFAMRAVLARSETAGQNLSLVVAQQVVYSIGLFGLLYSAYTLALDRDFVTNGLNPRTLPGPLGLIGKLMRSRNLIRIVLLAAVALGIYGGVKESSNSETGRHTGDTLRRISIYFFLAVSCLFVIMTIILAIDEHRAGVMSSRDTPFGKRFGIFILMVMAALYIVREAYTAASFGSFFGGQHAATWYVLSAGTELVAAVLFLVPGLVPSKLEIKTLKEQRQQMKEKGQWQGSQSSDSDRGTNGYAPGGQGHPGYPPPTYV